MRRYFVTRIKWILVTGFFAIYTALQFIPHTMDNISVTGPAVTSVTLAQLLTAYDGATLDSLYVYSHNTLTPYMVSYTHFIHSLRISMVSYTHFIPYPNRQNSTRANHELSQLDFDWNEMEYWLDICKATKRVPTEYVQYILHPGEAAINVNH